MMMHKLLITTHATYSAMLLRFYIDLHLMDVFYIHAILTRKSENSVCAEKLKTEIAGATHRQNPPSPMSLPCFFL